MGNRTYAVVTGIFVLVLGGALIAGAIWLKGPSNETRPYVVVSRGSVYGLMPQSTVFFRGVAAGSVESLSFDPKDARAILVRIEINRGVPITRSTVATLNLQGVTGLSQLELENTEANSPPLSTSTQFPASIPLQPSLLDEIGKHGIDVMKQLDLLTTNLNNVLSGSSQRHIQGLLANAEMASAELVTLEQHLDRAAELMPDLARHSTQTLKHVDALLTNLDELSVSLQHLSQNGQTATGEMMSNTLPALNQTLYQLSRAATDIHRLSVGITNDPQRLLLGPQRLLPGPGEPGYKGPMP